MLIIANSWHIRQIQVFSSYLLTSASKAHKGSRPPAAWKARPRVGEPQSNQRQPQSSVGAAEAARALAICWLTASQGSWESAWVPRAGGGGRVPIEPRAFQLPVGSFRAPRPCA